MCNYNVGGPDPPSSCTRINLELVNRDREESELCGYRGRSDGERERESEPQSEKTSE
jgi:hypothetical protein